jgi:hypothetical protein
MTTTTMTTTTTTPTAGIDFHHTMASEHILNALHRHFLAEAGLGAPTRLITALEGGGRQNITNIALFKKVNPNSSMAIS